MLAPRLMYVIWVVNRYVYIGWWWWVKPQVAYGRGDCTMCRCLVVYLSAKRMSINFQEISSHLRTYATYLYFAPPSSTRKCANDVYLGNLITSLILSEQDVGGKCWQSTRRSRPDKWNTTVILSEWGFPFIGA